MSDRNGHGDIDLIPSNLLSTIETLTPEVLPDLPRNVDRRIWNDQQAFLGFYVEHGRGQARRNRFGRRQHLPSPLCHRFARKNPAVLRCLRDGSADEVW